VKYLWNRLTFPYVGFYEPVASSNLFAPALIPNPEPTSDPSYTAIRQQQTALFVTDYVRITEHLNVFAGLRYIRPRFETFFNEDLSRDSLYEESALTPSGGIVVKPRPDVSLYASYAEGLEAGGTAPVGTSNANDVLPPLESRQYEAGVKVDVAGGALFSLAAFQIDKGLEFTNDQRVYVQDGRQVHRGVEASLAGELNERLRVVASAQYLDAEIRRTEDPALIGRRPVNVPEFQASVYGDWALPVAADFALSAGVFYSGPKYADELNTFRVDGLTRLDVGARYAFRLGRTQATLRAVLENVTDEDGFTGVNYSFQYAAPRTLRVSLSATY
jgi:iron complex outermembrane recepter protein